MQTRIYVVEHPAQDGVRGRRLVEATSAAAAIRHCVQQTHIAKIAAPKDIAAVMSDGVTVERAEAISTPSQAV